MEIQIYYFSNEATVSGQAYYDLPIKEVGLLTQQTVSASILPSNLKHLSDDWELGPLIKSLRPSWLLQLLKLPFLHCFYHTIKFYYGRMMIWMMNAEYNFTCSHIISTKSDSGFLLVLFYTKFSTLLSKQAVTKTMQTHVGRFYPHLPISIRKCCMLSCSPPRWWKTQTGSKLTQW